MDHLNSRLDMRSCNANDKYLEKIPADRVPDVILVKKMYPDKALRNRKRKWKLKHMEGVKGDTASQEDEYERFLEDLEEDPDLRSAMTSRILTKSFLFIFSSLEQTKHQCLQGSSQVLHGRGRSRW